MGAIREIIMRVADFIGERDGKPTWKGKTWLEAIGAVAQAAFDAKFHGTTGHKHTGADGDGPVLGEYGSNAYGEYVKYPNGVLECWGQLPLLGHLATDASYELTVTLPHAFVDSAYTVTGAHIDNGALAHAWEVAEEIKYGSKTTTSFVVRYSRNGAQFGYTAAAGFYDWHAKGRWK